MAVLNYSHVLVLHKAPFASAGVVLVVFIVVPFVTLVAKVAPIEEARKRVAPVVMIVHFDEQDMTIGGWTCKGDHVKLVYRQYFYLIGGNDGLEHEQLTVPAQTFGYAGQSVQFARFSPL